jgi:sugar (pentulose or hexulose) kinase
VTFEVRYQYGWRISIIFDNHQSNLIESGEGNGVLADRAIIVLDVGKTMAKLTLWDESGMLIERATRSNARAVHAGCAVLDVVGIEDWMAATLTDFARRADVGAIIPVAHGAAAAIIRDGRLVAPPIDYEAPVSAEVRDAYNVVRPLFSETGSPALPDGLNLGVQLYQQAALITGDAQILMWPQYWAWRLSGVAATEVSSLGTHTDLWCPSEGRVSSMVRAMGWAEHIPPVRKAGDVLGVITADWASRTGLPLETRIHCGVHDSNAALVAARGFAEIVAGEATVLSTGTWFIAMRTPDVPVSVNDVPQDRDCLANVDVEGQMIPSARWMGGREIETQIGIDTRQVDIRPDQPALLAAVAGVVAAGAMLLPGFAPGCGPFPDRTGAWIDAPQDWFARRAAVCLYAAMMTNVSLDLIGGRRAILIEGRFAEADVFVRALASLRPDDAIYVANAHNDVSFGALRLIDSGLKPAGGLVRVAPLDTDLTEYRARWTGRAN